MVKKKKTENKLLESKDSEIKSLKDDVVTYKSLAQRAQADLVNFRKTREDLTERIKNLIKSRLA